MLAFFTFSIPSVDAHLNLDLKSVLRTKGKYAPINTSAKTLRLRQYF